MSARDSLHVTKLLIAEIVSDEKMCDHIKGEPYVSWTGASFHVLFELKQPQPAGFHDRHLGVSAVKYWTPQPVNGLNVLRKVQESEW